MCLPPGYSGVEVRDCICQVIVFANFQSGNISIMTESEIQAINMMSLNVKLGGHTQSTFVSQYKPAQAHFLLI